MSFYTDGDDLPTHDPRPRERGSGAADLAITIALLLLLVVTAAALSFAVILEEMGVAACSGAMASCNFTLLGVTTWITPMAGIASVVLTLVALATRAKNSRRSWWVPPAGLILTVIAFTVASTLVSVALGM